MGHLKLVLLLMIAYSDFNSLNNLEIIYSKLLLLPFHESYDIWLVYVHRIGERNSWNGFYFLAKPVLVWLQKVEVLQFTFLVKPATFLLSSNHRIQRTCYTSSKLALDMPRERLFIKIYLDIRAVIHSLQNLKPANSFFLQVCLTCCSRDVIVKVDQICHKNSIKFFTGDVFGYHGYTFANLGEHEFVE